METNGRAPFAYYTRLFRSACVLIALLAGCASSPSIVSTYTIPANFYQPSRSAASLPCSIDVVLTDDLYTNLLSRSIGLGPKNNPPAYITVDIHDAMLNAIRSELMPMFTGAGCDSKHKAVVSLGADKSNINVYVSFTKGASGKFEYEAALQLPYTTYTNIKADPTSVVESALSVTVRAIGQQVSVDKAFVASILASRNAYLESQRVAAEQQEQSEREQMREAQVVQEAQSAADDGNFRRATDLLSPVVGEMESQSDSRYPQVLVTYLTIVAKLTKQPPPTEESVRAMVHGQTRFKAAQNPAQMLDSVSDIKEAIRLSPWCVAYYYNLGIVYQNAREYSEAKQYFQYYLLGAPNAPDAEDVRRRIYALEVQQ